MKTELDKNEKPSTAQEAPPIANVLLGEVLYYRGCYKEKHYDLEIKFKDVIYCLYATMTETETHPFFVSDLRFKERYKIKRSEKKQILQIATEFCLKNFA